MCMQKLQQMEIWGQEIFWGVKGDLISLQAFQEIHVSWPWAVFNSPRKSKSFQDSPSHRILWHMYEALNIDENKN